MSRVTLELPGPAPADVLAVDGAPSSLAALAAALEPLGVNVVRAASAAEALELLPGRDFAVAIFGAEMPALDGFELARRIRAEQAPHVTPIIFLTAVDLAPSEVRRAYLSGAVDFVARPLDPDVLRSKVSLFLDLARQTRQIALKDELLAVLAHELRTPLMSLTSAAESLERTPTEDPTLARLHGLVRRQTAHLRRLVDDALEMARFSEGKIDLRRARIDLRGAVERGIEIAQAGLDAQGIDLDVTSPPAPIWVDGDEVRLAQAVSNLVTNAAKFSDWGGRVAIGLCATDAEVTVSVRDWGRGISAGALGRIFEPFVQAEAADTWRGGLGIGLALVKRLVQAHDGKVGASSQGSGHGSTFLVTLPVAVARAGGAPPTAKGDAPAARVRVLVVDDSPDVRSAIALYLRLEGHSVLTAGSGRAALDEIRRTDPDVVLLDVGLPDLDGYAVAARVRALRAGPRPRLIALTGQAHPGERDRALRAGFDAHVAKPVDGRVLAGLVAETDPGNPGARDDP